MPWHFIHSSSCSLSIGFSWAGFSFFGRHLFDLNNILPFNHFIAFPHTFVPPCPHAHLFFLCSPWLHSGFLNSYHAESKDFNFLTFELEVFLVSMTPKHEVALPWCLFDAMSSSPGHQITAWAQPQGPGPPPWPPPGHLCHLSPLLQPGPVLGLMSLVENWPRKKTKGSFLPVLVEGTNRSWAPVSCVGLEVAQCFFPDSSDRARLGLRSCLCLHGTRRWMKRCGIIWWEQNKTCSAKIFIPL